MYIAPGRSRQPIGDKKFYDTRKAFSVCPYVASFKRISSKFIQFYWFLLYITPGQGQKPLGDKFLMSTESPYHFDHLLQVSNRSLWILIFFTFFNIFSLYIAPGQRQTTRWGQNPDVNRKALPLCCKFQKNIFEVWFCT